MGIEIPPPDPSRGPVPPAGTIDLDEVEKTPLAGEGNFLYRIPWGDGHVVAKIYRGSRSPLVHLQKSLGNALTGRTTYWATTRWRTETDCVLTWERHGFRCFRMFPGVEIAGLPRQGYMVFEYLPGRHFRNYFKEDGVPLEERLATWRRWVLEWHRRHRIAVEESDPRLIHENGDVKHVMLVDDDFLYFDFEMIFRSKNLRMLVGREILMYMRSVGRFFGEAMYRRMMDDLVEHYPDKALLLSAWQVAWRHSNPVMRFLRRIDRLKPTNRKRWSKYRVALELRERLDDASLTKRANHRPRERLEAD